MKRPRNRSAPSKGVLAAAPGTLPAATRSNPPAWLCIGILLAAGTLVYLNSFGGVFLLDDERVILDNPRIGHLWPPDWLFKNRRPVLNFSIALNHTLGGEEVGGYHLVNLIVHLLAGATLFAVLRRTFAAIRKDPRDGNSAWLALACALLWIVHPLQTQSVTYITQRSESMMGLFFLLTVYCLIRATSGSALWCVAGVAACLLGMASKAVMIVAPPIVLLFECVFLTGSMRNTIRCRWGFYLGLCATWLLLLLTGEARGVLAPGENSHATVGFGVAGVTPSMYFLTECGVILHYLGLCLWPHPLCLDYGWPFVNPAAIPASAIAAATIVLAMLTLTLIGFLVSPRAAFLGVWFFAILAPASSFIPIADAAFEHRMYLSLAAVVVSIVLLARWIMNWAVARFQLAASAPLDVSIVLTSAAALALGAGTFLRNRDYQTAERMWSSVLQQAPHNHRAHNMLGLALVRQNRLGDGIAEYRRAIALDPSDFKALSNLGVALDKQGSLEEAVACYQRALQIVPDRGEIHYNLATVLNKLGQADEAHRHFDAAVSFNPSSPQAYNNRGVMLEQQGRIDEAIEQYRQALAVDPASIEALQNLGGALAKQGRSAEVLLLYANALRIKPEDARLHALYAARLVSLSRFPEAIEHLNQALQIKPADPDAWNDLCVAYLRSGQAENAVRSGTEAVRLKPDSAKTHVNLAGALITQGNIDAGIEEYRRAQKIEPLGLAEHLFLAKMLRKKGRVGEAKAEYQAILKANPGQPEALEQLRGL